MNLKDTKNTKSTKDKDVEGLDVVSVDLDVAYQQMAQDEAREAEALEWAEATFRDIEQCPTTQAASE